MPPRSSRKRKDRIRTNRAMEIASTRPHQSRISTAAMRGAARIRMLIVMSTDFATSDGVGRVLFAACIIVEFHVNSCAESQYENQAAISVAWILSMMLNK
jgi:hypothetical protein